MRHHGWELPYHPLQIVAIAVFFALVFGFYVFIVPFTGSRILEILTIATYSPTIVVVFVVYSWCVAANPADVGVRISKKRLQSATPAPSSRVAEARNEVNTETQEDTESPRDSAEVVAADNSNMKHSSTNFKFSNVLLAGLAHLVQTCKHIPSANPLPTEEGMLYCTLCKAGIFKCSKHCRVCDKCIDGFDHHCRWLNNCIGRRNYGGFVVLMASGIMMLILQWLIGLWVMVHFFLNLKHFKNIISSKLGSSFSSIAYIIVVALCTLLAMVATYPLAQLFCFHILLMKKGISTYDYIIAMKEQQHKVGGESALSPLTSPASSNATANSGGSFSGLRHGRAWCTPPRLFFDKEDAFAPERYVDGVLPPRLPTEENLGRKTSVKVSPWALASLKKEDVLHVASMARSKSPILHQFAPSSEKQVITEPSRSLNIHEDIISECPPPLETRLVATKVTRPDLKPTEQSFVISPWHNGKHPLDTLQQEFGFERTSGNTNKHTERGKKLLNPVQMEARIAFKTSREFSVSRNPASSSDSSVDSSGGLELPDSSLVPTDWQWIENSANDDGSGCESTDDSDWAKSLPCAQTKEKLLSFAHQSNPHYSTTGKVFVSEISAGSSTVNPRIGDETKVETRFKSYADLAYEHTRMATANDMPSHNVSRERTRISKYMASDPGHLHL